MRKITTLVAAWLLTACGMTAVPKKIDRTNDNVGEMNGKMDKTNNGLDEVGNQVESTNEGLDHANEQLKETNEGLDNVSGQLDQTNAGLGQVSGQLDQTNAGLGQVSGQLDQTNAGLGQVSGQLDQTNAGLAGVGDQLSSTNNGLLAMLDEIRRTNTSMDQMNGQMQTTNAAIHNQILLLSLQELQKPENTLVLMPPTGMIPAGKKFAEEATETEVLELSYAWLLDIEHASLDEQALRDAGYPDADIPATLARFAHEKEAKFVALQIINGFLPQTTVDCLARHVAENGRYRDAALAALMLRSVFIMTMRLEAGLFAERLSLHGKMVEAVQNVAYIDYLGRLPFAREIGLHSDRLDDLLFEPKSMLTYLYSELDRRFDSDIDPIYRDPNADANVLQQAAELRVLHAKVKENLAYWEAAP